MWGRLGSEGSVHACSPDSVVIRYCVALHGVGYDYLWAEAEDAAGNLLEVVTYRVGQVAPEGRPGSGYLRTIREAARQRGLPDDYIAFLDRAEARE